MAAFLFTVYIVRDQQIMLKSYSDQFRIVTKNNGFSHLLMLFIFSSPFHVFSISIANRLLIRSSKRGCARSTQVARLSFTSENHEHISKFDRSLNKISKFNLHYCP